MPHSTKSVVISGYYGFDNLGDEAILEQLCRELREIDPGIKICVLSQNPQSTSRKYDVESISRWSVTAIYNALGTCDLFISGGGGLFQDSSSIKSVVYYAFLFFLARLKRVSIFVYAQGIGPLKSDLSRFLTQASMSLAACISVRDKKSQLILKRWNLDSYLTADPVWSLSMNSDTSDTNNGANRNIKIGLSLRQCDVLDDSWLETISSQLKKSLPPKCTLVPLVLQESLDKPVLDSVTKRLDNIEIEQINLRPDDLPSLWLRAISQLDMMVAMRLHAAIMALKSGVPTLAMAYDPKVSNVAKDFAQPYIEMKSPESKKLFESKLLELLENTKELEQKAKKTASDKEKDARQNKELLAKFLR
jgi:polysaccharide pyruvyl transferase CsaB